MLKAIERVTIRNIGLIEMVTIRNIRLQHLIWRNKNDSINIPVIPSFDEIKSSIITQIESLGFSVDTQSEKYKCNCIVRVFQKKDYEHGDSLVTLYGASCFLPRAGQWVSHGLNGKEFKIDRKNCIWRSWIFQDEYIDFECKFEDFYIKVEKK